MKRYGPSRRIAENASAALRIFVRHPKKTFATKSANSRHLPISLDQFVGLDENGLWYRKAECFRGSHVDD
jgi:hypothetical protein